MRIAAASRLWLVSAMRNRGLSGGGFNSAILLLCMIASPVSAATIVNQWAAIQSAFFADKTIQHQPLDIQIEAPSQAEDAAIVPVTIEVHLPASYITRVHLFTDANPIVHTATFVPQQPMHQFKLSTRIRLESNSHFRVIAEDDAGQLLMNDVVIKTPGGGCGGGISSDEARLRASAGEMKVQSHRSGLSGLPELSFHIRHPMRTGFERTAQGYYAKAWYMQHLAFQLDTVPWLKATLGPGISANPYLRFSLEATEAHQLSIEAKDNEGQVFHQQFSLGMPD